MKHPEWLKLKAKETVMPIVCRASNRIIVGAPLCQSSPLFDVQVHKIFNLNNYGTGRNSDYMDLNINFTITVMKAALILRYLPPFLKP